MMASQIVAYQVTRAVEKVADGTEHGTAAKSPYIKEILYQTLESEAYVPSGHAALWAATSVKAISTMRADVMLMHHSRHSYWFFHALF